MKSIRITGGPDPSSLRVVDAATGAPITGITKIELSVEPGGALCTVTQVFKVASIDVSTKVDVVNVQPAPIPPQSNA